MKLNGLNTKPSKKVRVGDEIEARTPGGLRIVEIVELSDKRGPAPVAEALYNDHSPPPPPKDSIIIVKMNLAAVSSSSFTTGVRIASGARGARVASSFSLLSSSHA